MCHVNLWLSYSLQVMLWGMGIVAITPILRLLTSEFFIAILPAFTKMKISSALENAATTS